MRVSNVSKVRSRVCLQEGPHLDLNWLARNGFVRRGLKSEERSIRWTHADCGDIAAGILRADMSGPHEGWLHIRVGELSQVIALVTQPRNFGGRQWYFRCPVTHRAVSILW